MEMGAFALRGMLLIRYYVKTDKKEKGHLDRCQPLTSHLPASSSE